MTTIVAVVTILITLGGFLDFLLGEPGNKRIKDRLINFYISIEEGDWSSLYRLPATALLNFIYRLLGKHIISIRFVIRTALLSLLFTAMMDLGYITIIYLHAVFHETPNCAAPPLAIALEVPVYLRLILSQIFIVNAIFDIATWSATICGLRIISTTRGRYAVLGVVLGIAVFSLSILKLFQGIYFSLSVADVIAREGASFNISQYVWTFRIGLSSISIFEMNTPIIVSCYSPRRLPFTISVIFFTRFAALEALIPTVLFVTTCLLGFAVYSTRRFTQKPVSLVIERLAASKNVCVTIAGLLSGLVAILKVLFGSPT
jgi:hypothetical protein